MNSQFNFADGKRGLSGIVATVLLVLLVIVIAGIIWGVVNNLLSEELSGAKSCFNILEKVKVNDRYTCLNMTANLTHLSIEIGDLDVESVTVSLANLEGSRSFDISSEGSSYNYLKALSGTSFGESVVLPGKNAAKTYVINNTLLGVESPTSISVAPKIDGEQCEVTDSMNSLENCINVV